MKQISDIAFKQGKFSLNYAEVFNLFDYFSFMISKTVDKPLQNIAIVFPNGTISACLILSCLRQFNVIPLSTKLSTTEYEQRLIDLPVDLLIAPRGNDPDSKLPNFIVAAEKLGITVLAIESLTYIMAQIDSSPSIILNQHKMDELNFEHFQGQITLFTSGSTGKEKVVVHSPAELQIAMTDAAYAYRISANDVMLHLLPLYHAHGLVTCLLTPFFFFNQIIFPEDGTFDSISFFDLVGREKPTWFAAVPTMLQSIVNRWQTLAQPEIKHDLRFIRSASSKIETNILAKLAMVFKDVPIFQAFGMTESPSQITTQQFNRNNTPGSVGYPLSSELEIRDENNRKITEAGQSGLIYIRGGSLFNGYHGKTKNESGFYSDGFFRTGDIGYLSKDSELFLIAREKDMINKGGVKINPIEIEEILLSRHPAIAEAVCFAISDHYYGENIAVAIVAKEGKILSELAIKEYISYFVNEDKLPRKVYLVKQIPKNNMGKIQRRLLEGYFNPLTNLLPADQYVENGNNNKLPEVNSEILEIVKRYLKLDNIKLSDNFFHLGGTSILATKITNEINLRYSVQLTIGEFLTSVQISDIAAQVVQLKPSLDLLNDVVSIKDKISFQQKRILFLYEYLDDKSLYNVPVAYSLDKNIDVRILKQALYRVVEDNQILKSVICLSQEDGLSYLEQDPLNFQVTDLEVINEDQLIVALKSVALKEFNLYAEIPIRAAIYTVKENNRQYLFLNIHHVAFDGWSRQIFNNQLVENYLNFIGINNLQQHKRGTEYIDFIGMQAQRVYSKVVQQKSFWLNHLAEYSYLKLPYEPDSCAATTNIQGCHVSDTLGFKLEPHISLALSKVANENNLSVFTVLLFGFQLLLGKISNQSDITIGITLANRDYLGVENCIGIFTNTLPLRFRIDDSLTFKQLIKQLNQVLIQVQSNADLPLEEIISALNLSRDKPEITANIFEVLFTLQPFDSEAPLAELGIKSMDNSYTLNSRSFFAIELNLINKAGQLEGLFKFQRCCFNKYSIENFIEMYQQILHNLIIKQEQPISFVTNLNQDLINGNNLGQLQFARGFIENKTIHQIFEEQVAKTPTNIAIVYANTKLSYYQLNCKANQLAHYLKATYSLKKDDLVAIFIDRSVELIVAILAILKAGAAYVPIDVRSPERRIGYILNDSKVKIILTNTCFQRVLNQIVESNSTLEMEPLFIDSKEFQQQLYEYPNVNPEPNANSTNLAYVIYTSGTTGNPKGVLQEHNNLVRLFKATQPWYNFNSNDSWVLFHSYAFDFSIWEIWGALRYGGKLVIPNYEQTRDFELFFQLCLEQQITILNQTPSAFYQFMQVILAQKQHYAKTLVNLRQIIFGGEALNIEILQPWFTEFGYTSPNLVNMYGITETTIHVSYKSITAQYVAKKPCLSIGVAIPDRKLYVLDSKLEPVANGIIGELYVGGAGLARGYLNQPLLTESKFIVNPFQSEIEKRSGENTKLYKSGDLVRQLANGELEYIGRIDSQVKIKGFRVELSEIEYHLANYPGISQAAAVVKSNSMNSIHKFLVGCYVSSVQLDHQQILDYLSARIPEYMLPKVLIHFDRFPLTPNGKLDLTLPELKSTNNADYIAPRNFQEQLLCKIYSMILGLSIEQVGINANFFCLGGDSIICMQLLHKIRLEMKLQLRIKDLFNYPTVEKLSNYLCSNIDSKVSASPLIQESGKLSGEFSLLPVQQWFFNNIDNGLYRCPAHWNLAFQIQVNKLDYKLLYYSLIKLIEQHDCFRLNFKRTGTNYIQYYNADHKFSLDSLLYLDVSKFGNLNQDYQEILTSWQMNFDLFANQPLFKVGFIDGFSDGSSRLFFVLHHLLSDGVSIRIIFSDLKHLYSQFLAAQSDGEIESILSKSSEQLLGFKGTSFRQWQMTIDNYKALNYDERLFWESWLIDLPTSQTDLENLAVNQVCYHKFSLDSETTSRLLANQLYSAPINQLLLTAFGMSLVKLIGKVEHYLILKGHGREEFFSGLNVNNTLGWFTAMYPVKLTVIPDSIPKTLKTIHNSLELIPNHGIGYGAIFGYTSNLPKICFDYVGQLGQECSGDDWQLLSAGEPCGNAVSNQNNDNSIIDINCYVTNNELKVEILAKLNKNKLLLLANEFKQRLNAF